MSHRQDCHCSSCGEDYGLIGAVLWLTIFGFVVSVFAVIAAVVIVVGAVLVVFSVCFLVSDWLSDHYAAKRERKEAEAAVEARAFSRTPGYPALVPTESYGGSGSRAIEAAPVRARQGDAYEYSDLRDAFRDGHEIGWVQGYSHGAATSAHGSGNAAGVAAGRSRGAIESVPSTQRPPTKERFLP